MLFPTLQFVQFFLLVFPVSWLLRWRDRPWKVFILAASYVFYAAWDWRFVGLIIASTLVNSVLARAIARPDIAPRRAALTVDLVFNLGLLGADYEGYFPAGDDAALAALMERFAAEPAFAQRLAAQCALREPLFTPAAERACVRRLLLDLLTPP